MTLNDLQLTVPMVALERVWPVLEPATRGEATKMSVWYALQRGARLWTEGDSALVSEVIIYPTGLRSVNAWLAGGNIDEVAGFMPKVLQWGKEQGCTQGRCLARAGFGRVLPGAKEVSRLFVRDI